MITSDAEESVVSVTVVVNELLAPVTTSQYSIAMKCTPENGPTVAEVKVYFVGVVNCRTFVLLSQSLNSKVQEPRLLVVQFQTVIQMWPVGLPPVELAATVRSNDHGPA